MTIMQLPIVDVRTTPKSVLDDRVEERGKCSGTAADAWHDPAAENSRKAAAVLCAGCPVRAECLESALRTEAGSQYIPFGVFGGMTPQDRKRLNSSRGHDVLAVAS